MFWVTFDLSSANAFNLGKPKILWSGKGLKSYSFWFLSGEYSQNICPKSDPACEPCQDKFPSCIGLQDGDHAFPTHLWGSDYVTCDRNRTVIPAKKCPGGGYFHPIQGLCTKTVDPSKWRSCHATTSWSMFSERLTHYQTTNFRLFHTERVCRQRFQIWRKWRKVI